MPNMKYTFIFFVHVELILLYHTSPCRSFAFGIPGPTKVLYHNACFMSGCSSSGRGQGEARSTPMKRQLFNAWDRQELAIKTRESDSCVRSTSSYQPRRVLLSRCSMVSSGEGATSMPPQTTGVPEVSKLAAFEIGLQKWLEAGL